MSSFFFPFFFKLLHLFFFFFSPPPVMRLDEAQCREGFLDVTQSRLFVCVLFFFFLNILYRSFFFGFPFCTQQA